MLKKIVCLCFVDESAAHTHAHPHAHVYAWELSIQEM